MSSNRSDVIIFSKDRPWQLQQLLKSILTFTDFRFINVILKSGEEYRENYEIVKSQFSKNVFYLEQSESIWSDFLKALKQSGDTISFMADDLIFYEEFSSFSSYVAMRKKNVFSYHFKLNMNYDYCHSVSKKQKPPKNPIAYKNHFMWKENEGTWDWYYPFDLTGTMYIKKDIKALINMIKSNFPRMKFIKNPNDIEMVGGNILFQKGININQKDMMACPSARCCASVSLNHSNGFSFSPINPSEKCTLRYLNNNVFGKYNYDLDFFRNLDQKSCHITEYRLTSI